MSVAEERNLTVKEIVTPAIAKLAALRKEMRVDHQAYCACLVLKLQVCGFEAYPLKVELRAKEKSFAHCVVLVENDGSLELQPLEGTNYVLVELLTTRELRLLFGQEEVRYNCADTRLSPFDPMEYITTMTQSIALALSHTIEIV